MNTNKIDLIKAEVERLKLCTMDEHMKFYSECAEAEYYALCKVEEIIDSLQEEPSKFDAAIQEGDDVRYNEDLGCRVNLSQLKRVAKKEDPVSEKKCIFTKDSYTDEDRKTLCEDCKEKCEYSKKEEPISEDLDSFAIKYAQDKPYPVAACQAVKVGAKWQVEQFEKNRLKHCNSITNEQAELEQGFIDQHLDKHQRMPTFLDAIEYGINWQKKQMMKDAIERVVKLDAGGYPYIDGTIELYDYSEDKPLAKAGDKVKIIIVKED